MNPPLKKKLTRRSALKSIGTIGVAPFVPGPRPGDAKKGAVQDASPGLIRRATSKDPDLHGIAAGNLIVEFDKETGTIHRISAKGDPLGTNFLGNRLNVSSQALLDPHLTGDILATVWKLKTRDWIREPPSEPGAVYPTSGNWQKETTLDSADARQISCWHSEALNGLALLTHFDDTGDMIALLKGYPGVWSVMRNVLADGMGFAWFMCSAGVFGFEPPRTFEGGLGLWGFLRAAKAYVVEDPAFGLIGYGCTIEQTTNEIRAFPKDGVKKRLRFVARGIDIEVEAGEISRAVLNLKSGALDLEMDDSTDLVKTVRFTVRGLRWGEYEVEYDGMKERRFVSDNLKLDLPFAKTKTIHISFFSAR